MEIIYPRFSCRWGLCVYIWPLNDTGAGAAHTCSPLVLPPLLRRAPPLFRQSSTTSTITTTTSNGTNYRSLRYTTSRNESQNSTMELKHPKNLFYLFKSSFLKRPKNFEKEVIYKTLFCKTSSEKVKMKYTT